MIKFLRYTKFISLILIVTAIIWGYLSHSNYDIYQFITLAFILAFTTELTAIYFLKQKRDNGDIHLFFNRNQEPLFLRWTIITLSVIILFFVILDSSDSQGWLWLTLLVTRGIEHYFKMNHWNALIENNAVHQNSFWMKAISISKINKVHINEQAELEITTSKGMTLFKLDSGTSVNLRDKIEALQAAMPLSHD